MAEKEIRKCRTCNNLPQGPAFANCADCARKFLQRLNDRGGKRFAPCLSCHHVHRGAREVDCVRQTV